MWIERGRVAGSLIQILALKRVDSIMDTYTGEKTYQILFQHSLPYSFWEINELLYTSMGSQAKVFRVISKKLLNG